MLYNKAHMQINGKIHNLEKINIVTKIFNLGFTFQRKFEHICISEQKLKLILDVEVSKKKLKFHRSWWSCSCSSQRSAHSLSALFLSTTNPHRGKEQCLKTCSCLNSCIFSHLWLSYSLSTGACVFWVSVSWILKEPDGHTNHHSPLCKC